MKAIRHAKAIYNCNTVSGKSAEGQQQRERSSVAKAERLDSVEIPGHFMNISAYQRAHMTSHLAGHWFNQDQRITTVEQGRVQKFVATNFQIFPNRKTSLRFPSHKTSRTLLVFFFPVVIYVCMSVYIFVFKFVFFLGQLQEQTKRE